MCTGAGTVAIKYNEGVLMASDTLISYGSMKKFPNMKRAFHLGSNTCVLTSGLFADTKFLMDDLRDLELEDMQYNDGVHVTGPKSIHAYLKLVMYQKRNDFNPSLCTLTVGGKEPGKEPFLGWVDSVGSFATDSCFASGLAHHFCMPLLCDATDNGKWKSLTREQATTVLKECLGVMHTRHTSTSARIQITDCTDAGCSTGEPFVIDSITQFKGQAQQDYL
eukprot:TRINITY_DN10785_c0_g1_i1.p1 TRINITY_DN10785_c0_g1~~TRINITY_DN10785_c0_g1_i1.p1  ORF type:complete len:221 (+),score=34.12 TRINITY_DN10785_c0_g1_i1:58-720(+)